MRNTIIGMAKILLPIVIITWLVYLLQNEHPETLSELRDRPKNWPLIGLSFAVCLAGVLLTFTRWFVLIRSVDIPIRWRDVMRLGFIGFLFNFVAPGAVGGDLFKAYFISREHPQRRTEAIATIFVDRAVGLYTLLLLAALGCALLLRGTGHEELRAMAIASWIAVGLGSLVLVLFFFNWISLQPLIRWTQKLKSVTGISVTGILMRLDNSARLYRRRWPALGLAILMGLANHALFAACLYLAAIAMFATTPTLSEHLLMWPIAGAAACIPGPPAGMGTFEFALSYLYERVPTAEIGLGKGVVVGLAYRIITIVIAGVGIVEYWTNRTVVRQVLQQQEPPQVGLTLESHQLNSGESS